MQPNFITMGSLSSKANWSKDGLGAFGHEGESLAIPVILRSLGRGLVVAWLKQNLAETMT
jgi:hypothetical protein